MDDPTIEVREKIIRMEAEIPSQFLQKCEERPSFDGETLSELSEVIIESENRAEECRVLHNSFVDYMKERN